MILSDNGDTTGIVDTGRINPETEQESSGLAIIQFTRLFKRDIWCWVGALQKLWWLFAIFPLLFACVLFFIRSMTTTNVSSAICQVMLPAFSPTANTSVMRMNHTRWNSTSSIMHMS